MLIVYCKKSQNKSSKFRKIGKWTTFLTLVKTRDGWTAGGSIPATVPALLHIPLLFFSFFFFHARMRFSVTYVDDNNTRARLTTPAQLMEPR